MTSRGSTFHVILACMLGAFACSSIAILAGYHIGFGIVAGLIVGYLAYDFRSVLKAIPKAFKGSLQRLDECRASLNQLDAALSPASIVALAASVLCTPLIWKDGWTQSAVLCVVVAVSIVIGAVGGTVLLYVVSAILAAFGTEFVEKKRIYGDLHDEFAGMSYARFWTLVAKGFGLFLSFVLWRAEIAVIKELFEGVALLLKGLWTLFLLVHRYERALCAIDGTCGGVLAYVLLIRPERTFTQNAIAVLFGMVVGAGWGVLNYEILSKRVLKVVPVTITVTQ